MKRIYVAGPMTGMVDLNFPAFDEAKNFLLKQGDWDVVSPADMDREAGMTGTEPVPEGFRTQALRKDVKVLCEMDAIVFLPGYSFSGGARLEALMAVETELEMYFFYPERKEIISMTESDVLRDLVFGIDERLSKLEELETD